MCGDTFTKFLEHLQINLCDELIEVNNNFSSHPKSNKPAIERLSAKFKLIRINRIVEALSLVTPDDQLLEAILDECYAGDDYTWFKRELNTLRAAS